MLQRGRATGGAEFSRLRLSVSAPRPASTGPRHGGRGILSRVFAHLSQVHASTGPRHGGRGIFLLTVSLTTGTVGFNGAAPRGARNSQPFRQASAAWRASTGPRPGGRGIQSSRHWGLRAERLQRGRAPGGAAVYFVVRESAREVGGFNGAAPRGARNFTLTVPGKLPSWKLQRGRAPGGAELLPCVRPTASGE